MEKNSFAESVEPDADQLLALKNRAQVELAQDFHSPLDVWIEMYAARFDAFWDKKYAKQYQETPDAVLREIKNKLYD